VNHAVMSSSLMGHPKYARSLETVGLSPRTGNTNRKRRGLMFRWLTIVGNTLAVGKRERTAAIGDTFRSRKGRINDQFRQPVVM
jgi:hypothetical protein